MKYLNSTFLTLVPKIKALVELAHFLPIACIKVLYKIMAKMLAEQIGKILPQFISKNQCAFVHGHLISKNSH